MNCWSKPTSKSAFVLSWISTILTTIFAVAGLIYYAMTGSAMCLVFGLENCVDFLSSVVVLWRFWASGTMTKEKETTLKRRELRASMAISFILVLLGIGVIGTSSYDIAKGPETNQDMEIVLEMAIISVFVFGTLTVIKFRYAHSLNSESLYKDGVCSLIGTMLAAALFTNTMIIRKNTEVWWLDPCVAMICGFSALFVGIQSTIVAWKDRRVPLFSPSWWMMSRGDGTYYYEERENRMKNKKKNQSDRDLEAQGREDDAAVEMKESGGGEATALSSEVL